MKFSLLYYSWKNFDQYKHLHIFTIVIMTYDVYNSFILTLMVVECIGKKSSVLLMMLLMMLFSISFAKNNCIFLKIFAFWNTCKRTVFHILKNPWKVTRMSFLKVNKNCCFKKFKIIAISRLKNLRYCTSLVSKSFVCGVALPSSK